jgi:hypothetical protein
MVSRAMVSRSIVSAEILLACFMLAGCGSIFIGFSSNQGIPHYGNGQRGLLDSYVYQRSHRAVSDCDKGNAKQWRARQQLFLLWRSESALSFGCDSEG